MIICVHCRKVMECIEIGKGVRYGENHVYPGDVFKCNNCGYTIIKTVDNPVYDSSKSINTIQMEC